MQQSRTVGDVLYDLMVARGWKGANGWRARANDIAPTIVGGSLKHGGPDLGPTRAKRAWASLGVDGLGIADEPPHPDFVGMPRLTVRMVARLQGFPDDWQFAGRKTACYRQIGNAFPPPCAQAIGARLMRVFASRGLRAGKWMTVFESARKKFHRDLAGKVFLVDSKNVPANADSDNNLSIEIARALAAKLSPDRCVKRPSGQTLGKLFEQACLSFCKDTFLA